MGVIDKYIPEKTLALDYNAAKIIASPYDYKLSERIFFKNNDTCWADFNIFNKGYGTEEYLCTILGLSRHPYLNPYSKIIDISKLERGHACNDVGSDLLEPLERGLGFIGTFIKYNNLIVNELPFLRDLGLYFYKRFGKNIDDEGIVKFMQKENLLKAIEVLFTKCTLKDSLIPNLMYLATEFHDEPLDNLENITFAQDAISKGNAPLIKTLWYTGETEEDWIDWAGRLLSTAMVPIYTSKSIPKEYSSFTSNVLFSGNEFAGLPLYNLGICYAILYGCELLYYFNNITDPVIKNALETLLSIEFVKDSFCDKYLYTIDDMGHIVINSEVLDCFDSNNEIRFNSIRSYFDKVLAELVKGSPVVTALNEFKLPTIFGRLIMSLHAYAFQVARIKHATLLYTEAKTKGVLNKDDFNNVLDDEDDMGESSLFGTSSGGSDDDSDIPNELIDLSTFETVGSKKLSDESLIEKEKTISKKDKETAPMLSAADVLKKDLHDSKYDFEINYVKNKASNKDSYNAIATNIHMITHELTRQIKEIKTYNTGGKQGGLLVGKLDKKNLWKYKTDPHIFYNNNYKIKEMDLAFGCILDESGSMHGEKIKNGRIVMVMLHEVLNALGINHSIIGHTSDHMYQSTIYKYFQFKEEAHYSLDKPYGLVSADNRNGNCDSGALYYMQSVMKSVRNKDKIVIIFSDGQPTECTDLDLTEQVRTMEKEGIHVIGVGINFNSIKEYYPDNANGKNLKEMVDIVVSILKRYVLEKKED